MSMTSTRPSGPHGDSAEIRLDLKPFGPGGDVDELLLHVRTPEYARELRGIAIQEGAYRSDVAQFSAGWEPILVLVCNPVSLAAVAAMLTAFLRRHRDKRIVFNGIELNGYSVREAERLFTTVATAIAQEQAAHTEQTTALLQRQSRTDGAGDPDLTGALTEPEPPSSDQSH